MHANVFQYNNKFQENELKKKNSVHFKNAYNDVTFIASKSRSYFLCFLLPFSTQTVLKKFDKNAVLSNINIINKNVAFDTFFM